MGEYSNKWSQIRIFKNSKTTYAHELGHHLGYKIEGGMRTQNAFYAARTVGDKTKVLPSFVTVKGKKDHWSRFNVYAGREYSDGRTPEVISVGVEYVWKNPLSAAKKDPEWFNMVISVLKGIPTK